MGEKGWRGETFWQGGKERGKRWDFIEYKESRGRGGAG